jgi:hypothetical protein
MLIQGAYTADVRKLMECVESKEAPLIQMVRTHQHHTNSVLVETVKNFENSFQSGSKHINHTIKEKWEDRRMNGQFPRNLDAKFVDKEQSPTDG